MVDYIPPRAATPRVRQLIHLHLPLIEEGGGEKPTVAAGHDAVHQRVVLSHGFDLAWFACLSEWVRRGGKVVEV